MSGQIRDPRSRICPVKSATSCPESVLPNSGHTSTHIQDRGRKDFGRADERPHQSLRPEKDQFPGRSYFLQVRNGYLHILDYKPEARKEKHAHVQLTIYALALSRRTNLPLKDFKCAWFDEHDYFEFFPLQAVYWPNGMRSGN